MAPSFCQPVYIRCLNNILTPWRIVYIANQSPVTSQCIDGMFIGLYDNKIWFF